MGRGRRFKSSCLPHCLRGYHYKLHDIQIWIITCYLGCKMKIKSSIMILLLLPSLSIANAQNKVVVVPLGKSDPNLIAQNICSDVTILGVTGSVLCPPLDCNGVRGGLAYIDDCYACVSGNTGFTPCSEVTSLNNPRL